MFLLRVISHRRRCRRRRRTEGKTGVVVIGWFCSCCIFLLALFSLRCFGVGFWQRMSENLKLTGNNYGRGAFFTHQKIKCEFWKKFKKHVLKKVSQQIELLQHFFIIFTNLSRPPEYYVVWVCCLILTLSFKKPEKLVNGWQSLCL